ncbi:hypothetical protein DM02DRAFT_378572 [Periconia macrospinosa]|uniref:Peptidase A2 domain-containing protein n=1 Tax=Periconia macrospinosa TaxID=97972 RepID=A0A2V1E8R5_9PLEO|nr:hypothetical protein DM02DRAFT_378572 [Periconia macrospinosa]
MMAGKQKEILAACSNGSTATLEALFQELNITSDHPRTPYDIDQEIPNKQRPVSVQEMFIAAIENQQIEIISILCTKFPKPRLQGTPLREAIRTENADVLRAVCQTDPESVASQELGDDDTINALGYAASRGNGALLVKVLLDAGADPNVPPPFLMPSCWNVSAAVVAGLPKSTFEQFFDAGFRSNDPHAARLAVENKRMDVLEVLFTRSKGIANAYFPPEEELLKAANEGKDEEMAATIKRLYAAHHASPKKGLLGSLVSKFRS